MEKYAHQQYMYLYPHGITISGSFSTNTGSRKHLKDFSGSIIWWHVRWYHNLWLLQEHFTHSDTYTVIHGKEQTGCWKYLGRPWLVPRVQTSQLKLFWYCSYLNKSQVWCGCAWHSAIAKQQRLYCRGPLTWLKCRTQMNAWQLSFWETTVATACQPTHSAFSCSPICGNGHSSCFTQSVRKQKDSLDPQF